MSTKSLMYLLAAVLILNVIVLYWLLFNANARIEKISSRQSLVASTSAQFAYDDSEDGRIVERNVTFIGPTQSCEDCVERLQVLEDDVSALKQTVSAISSPSQSTSASSANARELFIPLGSGSTSKKEWTDISGASAYINADNYSGISTVVFEGSIRVPQKVGQAYVRLYNKTGDHPVWFSEQSTESDTAFSFQSDTIVLDSGNNLYQVQMKSSIGAEVFVDSARVKILLQ